MNLPIENKIPQIDLRRKIMHVLLGILGLVVIIYNILTPLHMFIILILGSFLSLLAMKYHLPFLSNFITYFEKKEKDKLPARALIFGAAGALLCLQLFPKNIALASISILVFADPLSYLIGKIIGKTQHFLDNTKNIEGHIAGALISSLFAMAFVPFYLAFAGALVAMLFEALVIEIQKIKLDDNLLIPLAAGTTMLIIVKFLI